MNKVSALIRTYEKDFAWLTYCLRGLAKHGRELHEIVIVVPERDMGVLIAYVNTLERKYPELESLNYKLKAWTPYSLNGYIDQQITKCCADQLCEGDYVMHLDSDCVTFQTIVIDDFFVANRPKLLFRRWEEAGDGKCWLDITKSVLIREPSFETMATHPTIYHRSTHELFRNHLTRIHGREFTKYVSRLAQFSEFNAMGNFAHLYTPDAYHFVRASSIDGYPRPMKQFWSHSKVAADDMEALLK